MRRCRRKNGTTSGASFWQGVASDVEAMWDAGPGGMPKLPLLQRGGTSVFRPVGSVPTHRSMSTQSKNTETDRIESKHQLRTDRLTLANSTIEFEVGPVGVFAKVVREDGRRDYAGPLPFGTIAALREVAE